MGVTDVELVAGAANSEPKTIWEFIERALARHAEAPALALRDVEPEVRWSYRELGQRIETAARHLAAAGLEPGALGRGLLRPVPPGRGGGSSGRAQRARLRRARGRADARKGATD